MRPHVTQGSRKARQLRAMTGARAVGGNLSTALLHENHLQSFESCSTLGFEAQMTRHDKEHPRKVDVCARDLVLDLTALCLPVYTICPKIDVSAFMFDERPMPLVVP